MTPSDGWVRIPLDKFDHWLQSDLTLTGPEGEDVPLFRMEGDTVCIPHYYARKFPRYAPSWTPGRDTLPNTPIALRGEQNEAVDCMTDVLQTHGGGILFAPGSHNCEASRYYYGLSVSKTFMRTIRRKRGSNPRIPG